MNYLTSRAISMMKYMLDRNIDPYVALDIVIYKYEGTKINIEKLKKSIKKEFKEYFEESDKE